MYSLKLNILLAIASWLLLSSCRPEATQANLEVSTLQPTASPLPPAAGVATAAATATSHPVPQLTAVPTTVPTSSPSPTAEPALRLAVPPAWMGLVQTAVDQLNQQPIPRQWSVVSAEDPGLLLTQAVVQAALVPGEEGTVIAEEMLAVAVPFTTAWENITEPEAQEILTQGHALAAVMPWDEMPRDHKALSIGGRRPDEEGYPLKRSWSLLTAPGRDAELAELAAALRAVSAQEPLVQLAAVGDLMLDRSLGNAIQQGNLAYPFAQVMEHLVAADITVGNLESALGDRGEPAQKHYTFRAPPQAALSLAMAGFDILSLANNHALDFGPDALLQGISLLNAQGILTAGAGVDRQDAHLPKSISVRGLETAFLSYVNVPVEVGGFDTASWAAAADTPGLAWGTPEQIRKDVALAAGQADLVVVLLHSGLEYIEAPSEAQMAAARAAIDAGSQLVISHHSHILQGIEYYREGVILYGVGNFAFQIEGDPQTAIFNIWLDRQGVRQIEVMPVVIQFGGQPRIALPAEAQAIRQKVYQLTTLLNPRSAP